MSAPYEETSNYRPTYGRALATQESHRRQGAFKPYEYHGTGEDTLTPDMFKKRGNTLPCVPGVTLNTTTVKSEESAASSGR